MLIERGHAKVAKAYILYREQHRKIREGKSLLTEGLELIESYLDRSDWRVNENSNMSYSLQGLNNHIAIGDHREVLARAHLSAGDPQRPRELRFPYP